MDAFDPLSNQTRSPRYGKFLGLALMLAAGPAAWAGNPVAGCLGFMDSDIVVFAEGDPLNEIVGHVEPSATCTDIDGDQMPELQGMIEIEFGPYDQVLACGVADDVVTISFSGEELADGAGGGGEPTHVPFDPNQIFFGMFSTELKTNCVSGSNLAYGIFDVKMSGAAGARTGDPGTGEAPTELTLPPNVRAEDGNGLIHVLQLGEFSLAQDMSFRYDEDDGPASALRFWPDGQPFRLGPDRKIFTPDQFTFTTDPVLGPPSYVYAPPQWDALNNLGARLLCDPNKPDTATDPCTGSQGIGNAGFLDAAWETVGVTIGLNGLSVDLNLAAGASVVYETLFPRGTWVKLVAPASVSIQDGEIVGGGFDSGLAWLRRDGHDLCAQSPTDRRFRLIGGGSGPQIGTGGTLLAGIEDLNPLDGVMVAQPVDWAAHTATDLGCGTFYVPPPATGDLPQKTWNESHVPTVLDRGIYAGFNYNRNQVCHDSGNTPLAQTCTEDADCDTAQGEYCADGGFSPLCPAIDPLKKPTWHTVIDSVARSFEIDPDEPGQVDREMALVMRRSGVTGVFDAGDDDFFIQSSEVIPGPLPVIIFGFKYDFDRYGLAYRESRRNGADTVTNGTVNFPWPAETNIPVPEMDVCTCGQPNGGSAPDVPIKNKLLYWDADYLPYGVHLTNGSVSNQPCADLFSAPLCDDASTDPNDKAIIQAVTPIPRLKPDPTSCFALDTAGKPAEFTPMSAPQLEFNEAASDFQPLDPYRFDIDYFELSPYTGQQRADDVEVGSLPYGYYDVSGELSVPYFGMTPAGLKIHPDDRNFADNMGPTHFPVDLHAKGNVNDSALTVERVIAADSVPVNYRLDYFSPEVTRFPYDGDDEITANGNVRGRGSLFAYTDQANIGATNVAGAMILTPENGIHFGEADLGPAAALRLWGATEPLSRLTELSTIINSSLLLPEGGKYDATIAKLGFEDWNLPGPGQLKDALLVTGAIDQLAGHPHESIDFNVGDPNLSPAVTGSRVAGYMSFDAAQEQVEFIEVISDQSSGGEFYEFDASLLQVDRHVKQSGMPITSLGRANIPGASQKMKLPGEQNIPFPSGSLPGIAWDYDYTVDSSGPIPQFTFNSLTGSMDLTNGGLSALDFAKMSATLRFYSDGDWYFSAALKLKWSAYAASGGIIIGNSQDMTPLNNMDPAVAQFLSGVTRLEGVYARMGFRYAIIDIPPCLVTIGAGVDVGGWFLSQSFGGKVRGYVFGDAVCLLTVHGDLSLFGQVTNSVFKFKGNFWVAGGIGFCDEEDWDTPSDVLDDDFCGACVLGFKLRGNYPPSSHNLNLSGPNLSCAL
jgi:hypothetical protein